VDNFGGVMPDNYHDLIQLKGVGPYTAAAIASFAFNLPHVVVDGNVLRVISRVFGIRKAIDNKKTVDTIKKIGQRMIIKNDPYSFNQAIMEFGAIRCVPKNPDCKTCVLKNECFAFTHHLVNTLPVKIKKQEKRIRFFQYTVLIDEENSTLVNRRKEKDIWRGLYEFPVRETSKADFDKYLAHEQFKEYHYSLVEVSRQYTQQLTHQTINSKFYKLILEKGVFLRKHKNLKKVSVHQLNKLAFPKTSCLYLSDNSITLVK
jgi:A/G-specific adenine glycosylase